MKIALYSPYLDTFGGGEKYMMTIAECLSSVHKVDVFLDKHLQELNPQKLKKKLSKRFNLSLSKVNFTAAPIGRGSSFFQRLFFLKTYDLLFYLTDGSIFYPTGKRNILHIQSPLIGQPAKSLWGKIKLSAWDLIIYNSQFTKEWSQKNWPLKSKVIYPPVDVDKIKPLKKEKYILSVGRFFGYLKDKKHGVIIQAFKDLYRNKKLDGWSLHLAGSASKGDDFYLKQLQALSKGFPVNFYPNIKYENLIKLYGYSSIYWHAAGYGEEDPVRMEHFGIAVVEAMSAGCIPVVINKGGLREIVDHGKNGYLWDSIDDLSKFSLQIIEDDKLSNRLRGAAIQKASDFNKNEFANNIENLVNE